MMRAEKINSFLNQLGDTPSLVVSFQEYRHLLWSGYYLRRFAAEPRREIHDGIAFLEKIVIDAEQYLEQEIFSIKDLDELDRCNPYFVGFLDFSAQIRDYRAALAIDRNYNPRVETIVARTPERIEEIVALIIPRFSFSKLDVFAAFTESTKKNRRGSAGDDDGSARRTSFLAGNTGPLLPPLAQLQPPVERFSGLGNGPLPEGESIPKRGFQAIGPSVGAKERVLAIGTLQSSIEKLPNMPIAVAAKEAKQVETRFLFNLYAQDREQYLSRLNEVNDAIFLLRGSREFARGKLQSLLSTRFDSANEAPFNVGFEEEQEYQEYDVMTKRVHLEEDDEESFTFPQNLVLTNGNSNGKGILKNATKEEARLARLGLVPIESSDGTSSKKVNFMDPNRQDASISHASVSDMISIEMSNLKNGTGVPKQGAIIFEGELMMRSKRLACIRLSSKTNFEVLRIVPNIGYAIEVAEMIEAQHFRGLIRDKIAAVRSGEMRVATGIVESADPSLIRLSEDLKQQDQVLVANPTHFSRIYIVHENALKEMSSLIEEDETISNGSSVRYLITFSDFKFGSSYEKVVLKDRIHGGRIDGNVLADRTPHGNRNTGDKLPHPGRQGRRPFDNDENLFRSSSHGSNSQGKKKKKKKNKKKKNKGANKQQKGHKGGNMNQSGVYMPHLEGMKAHGEGRNQKKKKFGKGYERKENIRPIDDEDDVDDEILFSKIGKPRTVLGTSVLAENREILGDSNMNEGFQYSRLQTNPAN
eukprot:TRINITY_DN840_c0_g1_i2.p1 TRINITY_DN840_c0_g1~~TRINITY_DN840_c0_g1_i2.p1  ORF type:complete len:757 (+),score=214.12 TRINITY_DN840_c0_g1_i2:276-2546(+)